MKSQTVHIVDDDTPFRAATARLLRLRGYTVEEYPSAENFLEHVRGGGGAGCVLLDVSLPGLSGPDLQARLTTLGSLFPIVFVTGHGDVPMTVRAMRAGAEDVLTKPVPQRELVDSIERAFAHYETEHVRQEWMNHARSRLDKLTPREREVFEFVVRGKTNKQIGPRARHQRADDQSAPAAHFRQAGSPHDRRSRFIGGAVRRFGRHAPHGQVAYGRFLLTNPRQSVHLSGWAARAPGESRFDAREAIDHHLSDERKSDPERRAAAIPIFHTYRPFMRFDDGVRDGQPHAHALGLGGEKRFEDLL